MKDLIRSRGRNHVTLFSRGRKKTSSKNALKMEIFLSRQGDTVDMESDSESEEETVFKINPRMGQWEGLEKGESRGDDHELTWGEEEK